MSQASEPYQHEEYDVVEPTPEALEMCARLTHVAVRALNDSRGEVTLDFGLIKAGLIHAIQDIIDDPQLTGSEMHLKWMEDKESKGWVYGETKDPVAKTHPCMVSYDKLPAEQRVKDDIVLAIAKEFFGLKEEV